MTDFTGASCPVCEEIFNKDERPVICTYCGAPYHRDCYNRQGFCVFADAHSNGYIWSAPVPVLETPEPECLKEEATLEPAETPEDSVYKGIRDALEKIGMFEQDKSDSLSPEERFIFGVSEKEIAHFQGGIDPLRLLRYRRIASGHKISINLFAGVFSPFYMFYTRMRVIGTVVMLCFFLLTLPSMIAFHFFEAPHAAPFTRAELEQAMSSLSYFSLALKIAIALFFDYFYLRWSAYKIKLIRSRFAPDALSGRPEIPDMPSVSTKLTGLSDDYYRELQSAGRPGFRHMLLDSLIVMLIVLVLYNSFINYLMT